LERYEQANGVITLSLTGELDLATVSMLEEQLGRFASPGRVIIADLRRLRFIDSSGLRAMLTADQSLRQAGARLVIVSGPRQVRRVFELTGVDRYLEFVDEPPRGDVHAMNGRTSVSLPLQPADPCREPQPG
jgi:anti-sigma B factor antagonist